jgi:hypothetical protein
MTKFTPGPWTAVGTIVLSPDTCGEVGCCGIAECFHGSQPEIAEANAQLIAAAPDLLEALRNLSATVDAAILSGDWKVDGACDPDMDIKAARAAIAKATGGQ